jgi:hypothetical protein
MSSTEYAELAGLKIALSNIMVNFTSEPELQVADWMKTRIKQLEIMKQK